MPTLGQSGAINQGRQQVAASWAGWVYNHLHQDTVSGMQSRRRGANRTGGLARQLFNFSRRRVVGEVLAVGYQVVGTDTYHFLSRTLAVGFNHFRREANDTAGFDDLPLHFKPQPLDFGNSRQTGIAVHFIDQVGQKLPAVGKLNAYQRGIEGFSQVASGGGQMTKQLTQGA